MAELREFQLAYHPEGVVAQRANASISRWQHRTFENSDIPIIVEDVASSIVPPSEGGLSFDRYRDALETLEGIQKCMPDLGVKTQDIISKMKRAIDVEPEAALSSVEHGSICWQSGGFPESMERVGAIDELRECICRKSLSSSAEVARAVLEKQEGCRPSDVIAIINGERGLTRSASRGAPSAPLVDEASRTQPHASRTICLRRFARSLTESPSPTVPIQSSGSIICGIT